MELLYTVDEVRLWKSRHQTPLAFVPTMGCLHEGHLSLIQCAQTYAPLVLMSIFVNPTQFNQSNDFDSYPRTLEDDLEKARSVGCSACFIPSVETIYPPGSQTQVSIGSLGDYLCGATRPGHFTGVCTVVSQLLHITQCDYAIFGQKDFQQLAIIQQMVRDLHFPVQVIGSPTYRHQDGLAMSSRNQRLSLSARHQAPALYQGLKAGYQLWLKGERNVDLILDQVPR